MSLPFVSVPQPAAEDGPLTVQDMAEAAGLDAPDVERLQHVVAALPLLADLCRADMVVYGRGPQPHLAVVWAQAQPAPVSPVFPEPLVGAVITKKNEPAVFQVLHRGRQTRVVTQHMRAGPTVQEVFPIRSTTDATIAALNAEANLLEYERMRKKSPVFRRALERIQQMAMAGKLASAATISRLGEHDGLAVIDDTGQIQYISGIAENLYRKLGHTGSLLSNHLADLQTDEQIVADCFAQGVCLEREVRQDSLVWIKKTIPILADDRVALPGRHGRAACSHVLLVIQDVTEQRQREQALLVKNAMIQEIHHRVKNNLQTIAALLRLQARRSANPEVAELLQSSVNRVLSVAVVHEFLSHDDDATINIRDVTARIISEVHGILDPEKNIRIVLQGDNVLLPAQQATSTALVINELLQNSVKHGYVDRSGGIVVVALREQDGRITIEIADDGVGLRQPMSAESDAHLGLTIVRTLVREDLRGEFSLTSDRGVTARLTFPRLTSKSRTIVRSRS